jgi:hypothetical protein
MFYENPRLIHVKTLIDSSTTFFIAIVIVEHLKEIIEIGDAKKKEKRCPISNKTSHLKDNFQLIMLQFYFYFIF